MFPPKFQKHKLIDNVFDGCYAEHFEVKIK